MIRNKTFVPMNVRFPTDDGKELNDGTVIAVKLILQNAANHLITPMDKMTMTTITVSMTRPSMVIRMTGESQ